MLLQLNPAKVQKKKPPRIVLGLNKQRERQALFFYSYSFMLPIFIFSSLALMA